MQAVNSTLGAQPPSDGACEERREYVTPAIEPLGTWQAVALASSLLRVTREF